MPTNTEWCECHPPTVNDCFKRTAKREHEAALSFWKRHNVPPKEAPNAD